MIYKCGQDRLLNANGWVIGNKQTIHTAGARLRRNDGRMDDLANEDTAGAEAGAAATETVANSVVDSDTGDGTSEAGEEVSGGTDKAAAAMSSEIMGSHTVDAEGVPDRADSDVTSS
jgi:hypothetical protein